MAQKRANGEGSISKRSSGGYMAQYYVELPDGRCRRRSIYAKTRVEVSRKLSAAIANRDQGLVYDETTSISEYLDRWLQDSKKGVVKATTHANYSYLVRLHITPALGSVRLKNLTPAHVRRFYAEKSQTNLAPGTVNKMHAVLREALGQALTDGLVPRNVADGVRRPRGSAPGEEIRPLDSEESEVFLAAARGERLEALYVLAIHCGIRKGELLALRWEDVDTEAAKPTVLVRRTLTRGEEGRGWVIGSNTKSGKGRRVRLTRQAVAALKDHRTNQLEERLQLAEDWRDEGLVFPNEAGSLMNPSNLRNRSFKKIKARAGIRDDLRFHDLRHTCATLLLSAGVNVKVVSEMLGHASITITLNIYSHVLPDMQDTAAEAMDAALGNSS